MKRFKSVATIFLLFPITVFCQQIIYSDFNNDDSREMNFEIIGKMNGNFLVYKNLRGNHKINIYDTDMKTIENVKMDFMPEKTFNVDFVIYPDYFIMIYQYQKKNILHCMGVKMNTMAKKMEEPIELDTTQIPFFTNNKIYSVINSEDKQKIMVFKIHKKNESFNIVTLLFNNNLKLIANKTRQNLDFNEQKDSYNNFSVDNDGNFIFTEDSKSKVWSNDMTLHLITKPMLSDTYTTHEILLDKKYFNEVKLKIDNLNKRYIVSMFYAKNYRSKVSGLNTYIWDKTHDSLYAQTFSVFSDSLRDLAKTTGPLQYTLDDYTINQIFLKKDGGFLLTAEDVFTQTRNNNNFNPYGAISPFASNYYYSPYYGYYRPLGSFNNSGTRYFYSNILILNADKMGKIEWNKIINKEQFDDDNDNYISYCTFNTGGQIHFLFNDDKNRNQVIANHSILPSGEITRNPTLKSEERGYMFMTRYSKQVGSSQLIIPCTYRGYICFAKVDL